MVGVVVGARREGVPEAPSQAASCRLGKYQTPSFRGHLVSYEPARITRRRGRLCCDSGVRVRAVAARVATLMDHGMKFGLTLGTLQCRFWGFRKTLAWQSLVFHSSIMLWTVHSSIQSDPSTFCSQFPCCLAARRSQVDHILIGLQFWG